MTDKNTAKKLTNVVNTLIILQDVGKRGDWSEYYTISSDSAQYEKIINLSKDSYSRYADGHKDPEICTLLYANGKEAKLSKDGSLDLYNIHNMYIVKFYE